MSAPLLTWNSALPDNAGTVGCLVRKDGAYGIVSASHVMCPLWDGVSAGAHRYIRVAVDVNTQIEAELIDWSVPFSTNGMARPTARDAALAIIDRADADKLIRRMTLPTALAGSLPQNGDNVSFLGSTSKTLKPSRVHNPCTAVNMRFNRYIRDGSPQYYSSYAVLSDTIQIDAMPATLGGDSGCMLFDAQGQALAMLVGTAGSYPYFMPLEPTLSLFRATLVTAEHNPANSIMNLIGE